MNSSLFALIAGLLVMNGFVCAVPQANEASASVSVSSDSESSVSAVAIISVNTESSAMSDMCGGSCMADEECALYDHCQDLKPVLFCPAMAVYKCQKITIRVPSGNDNSGYNQSEGAAVAGERDLGTSASGSNAASNAEVEPSAEVSTASAISGTSSIFTDMCGGKCRKNEICAFYNHCRDLAPGRLCPAIAHFKCQKNPIVVPALKTASFLLSVFTENTCGGKCAAGESCRSFSCTEQGPNVACPVVALFKCQKK